MWRKNSTFLLVEHMQVETPRSTTQGKRWLILIAIVLSYLPIVIDMTVLHIAVPSLTLALGATGEQVLWIIDIYPLLMAGLLVPMGTLADRVGSRKLLLSGLVVFVVMSTAAAYSPTAMALILSRAGMAVGAAMAIPCTLAIIRQTFDDEKERALALGIWSSVAAGGAAVGPLVGGALIEHFWWGAVFLINLPIMLLIWPVTYSVIPRTPVTLSSGEWQIGQALMLIVGILATIYALKSGVASGLTWRTGAILLFGLLLLGTFVHKQLHSTNPLLHLSLFSQPPIRSGLAMALVVSGALAGTELTIAQELQLVLGRSPLEAAMFLLPLMVAAGVGGALSGYLVGVFGLRMIATLSLVLSAVSLAGLGLSDFQEAGYLVTAMLILLGLALSVGLTASSIAIMGCAPPQKAGSAGSLEATSYELGTGLGISLFGVLLNMTYSNALVVPTSLSSEATARAMQSLGDTLVVVNQVDGALAETLSGAGKEAFSMAHSVVLTSAAYLVAVLAIWVYRSLGKPRRLTKKADV